jgi:hypothetical protein
VTTEKTRGKTTVSDEEEDTMGRQQKYAVQLTNEEREYLRSVRRQANNQRE